MTVAPAPVTVVVPVIAVVPMVPAVPMAMMVPVVPVMPAMPMTIMIDAVVIDVVPTHLLRLHLVDRVLRHDRRFKGHGDRRLVGGHRRQRRRLCGRCEHHASRNKPHRKL